MSDNKKSVKSNLLAVLTIIGEIGSTFLPSIQFHLPAIAQDADALTSLLLSTDKLDDDIREIYLNTYGDDNSIQALNRAQVKLHDISSNIYKRFTRKTIIFVFGLLIGIVLSLIGIFTNDLGISVSIARSKLPVFVSIGVALSIFSIIAYFNAIRVYRFSASVVGFLSEKNKDDIDLLRIGEEEYEKRAEKQFSVNQRELKRYHDLNLTQLKWVFPLGVFLLFAGVTVIVLSLLQGNTDINYIIPGCVSGIMVDFIGALFIHIHSQTIKTSNEFHNRLSYINLAMYSNVMIAKISDQELRDKTITEMVKIMAQKESLERNLIGST